MLPAVSFITMFVGGCGDFSHRALSGALKTCGLPEKAAEIRGYTGRKTVGDPANPTGIKKVRGVRFVPGLNLTREMCVLKQLDVRGFEASYYQPVI